MNKEWYRTTKEKDICNHNNKEWNHIRNDITIVKEEKKRRPGEMWGLARNSHAYDNFLKYSFVEQLSLVVDDVVQ